MRIIKKGAGIRWDNLMIELKNKPTPRIYQLHEFLMDAFNADPTRYHKAKAIQEQMPLVYIWNSKLDERGNPLTDSDGNEIKIDFYGTVGRAINFDVQFHNNCGKFYKMIIGDRTKGYKIATKEEYLMVSAREWREIAARIKRRRYMDSMYSLDGQCKIRFEEEPNGRSIYDVFPDPAAAEHKKIRIRKAKSKKRAPLQMPPPIAHEQMHLEV